MAKAAIRFKGLASQSRFSESVNDVFELEAIIDDHYDLHRYVNRRAVHLGNQFMSTKINTFEIARTDAAEVFDSNLQELSVQEIRRREMRKEIEPLLPLPTTANTQTLDDFQSYPAAEWNSGMRTLLPTTVPAIQNPLFTQVNSTLSLAGATGPATISPTAFAVPGQPPQSSASQQQDQAAAQATSGVVDQANTANALNEMEQTTQLQLSDTSSSPFQDNSFSSSFAIDSRLTAATSPASAIDSDPSMQVNYPQMQPADPELLTRIVNALGTEEGLRATDLYFRVRNPANEATAESVTNAASVANVKGADDVENVETEANAETMNLTGTVGEVTRESNADIGMNVNGAPNPDHVMEAAEPTSDLRIPKLPNQVSVAAGVASLASRAVPSVVKPQKGKKRARSPDTSSEESIQDQPETAPPPSKKVKLVMKGPKQPEDATGEGKATKTSKTKSPARKSTTKHVDSVMSGNTLPRTAEEATTAQQIRLTRLIASNDADRRARKRRAIKQGDEPDLMPEHFYTKNFKQTMEVGNVRCVCGVTHDDLASMISCDGCNVWQHDKCMGKGVPKNPKEEAYFCHVCDSWAHRELIAKLRRAHPL